MDTEITGIGSTVEPIHDMRNRFQGFDCDVVFWGMVKRPGWKKAHKLVVKIPAVRAELSQISQARMIDIALKKMENAVNSAEAEPE